MAKFKWGFNTEPLETLGSMLIFVDNGTADYSWEITEDSGNFFSFSSIDVSHVTTSTATSVLIYAASGALGQECTVYVTDDNGDSVSGNVKCCMTDCCNEADYAFSFDSDTPFRAPPVSSSSTISIIGGCKPFTWEVSGSSIELTYAQTNSNWNKISRTGNTITGTEELTVTDSCGTEINATIDLNSSTLYLTTGSDDSTYVSAGYYASGYVIPTFNNYNQYLTLGNPHAPLTGSKNQIVIIRFRFSNIPQGAIIDSAYISVKAYATSSDNASILIRMSTSINPTAPASESDAYNHSWSSSKILWNLGSAWSSGMRYESSELKTLMQQMVSRSDYISGNSFMFELANVYELNAPVLYRNIISYNYSGQGDGPQLIVYWRTS